MPRDSVPSYILKLEAWMRHETRAPEFKQRGPEVLGSSQARVAGGRLDQHPAVVGEIVNDALQGP
jgi:hypothetical protein